MEHSLVNGDGRGTDVHLCVYVRVDELYRADYTSAGVVVLHPLKNNGVVGSIEGRRRRFRVLIGIPGLRRGLGLCLAVSVG